METALDNADLAALAGIMLMGALVPGVSVFTVAARSLAFGFQHGLATAAGIVAGDLLFILIAIYGLSILAAWAGGYFYLFQYVGGAYLIGLGLMLWWSTPAIADLRLRQGASPAASFLVGLAVTLADQKAILFYLAFLPAFVDLSALSVGDTAAVLGIATVAVGAPKIMYALVAARAVRVMESLNATRVINRLAGTAMVVIGIYLVVTA